MMFKGKALGLCVLLLFTAGLFAGCGANKQDDYPTKPIEFVVHTNPGDSIYLFADSISKLLNEKKIVTQPMTVNPKTGGSGAVAYGYVAQKANDPYFLLSIQPSAITTPILQKLDVSWKSGFVPIACMIADENVIAVRKDSKFQTMKDLIDEAKKDPKSVSMAGTIYGAADSIVTYLVEKEAGVTFNFVSFKSAGESIVATLGGNTDAVSCNPSEIIGQVQSGDMRVLGVASEERSPFLPDTPTFKEQGLNVVFNSFRGIVAPPGVSEDVIEYWNDALSKLRELPEWQQSLKNNTNIDFYMDTQEFKSYLDERDKFYQTVLAEMGLLK